MASRKRPGPRWRVDAYSCDEGSVNYRKAKDDWVAYCNGWEIGLYNSAREAKAAVERAIQRKPKATK